MHGQEWARDSSSSMGGGAIDAIKDFVAGFVYAMSIVLLVVGSFLLINGASVTMCWWNGSNTECTTNHLVSLFSLYIYNNVPLETFRFGYSLNILGLSLLVIGFAESIALPEGPTKREDDKQLMHIQSKPESNQRNRRMAVSLIIVGALILVFLLLAVLGSITDCGSSCTNDFDNLLAGSQWFLVFLIIDTVLLATGVILRDQSRHSE